MLSVTHRAKRAAAKLWPPIVARGQQAREWAKRNPQRTLWVVGVTVAVLLLVLLITHWNPYKAQREVFAPIFTLAAGLAVAGVILMRHFAQTEADRQRRITESFSKAVEQLAHKDIEIRLGGIYTLERISKERPYDYWTIMETLTAFVRERARWREPQGGDETDPEKEPSTDIAAVLAVIVRRPEKERERERREGWRFNLRGVDLRGANLYGALLDGAELFGAHLDGANLCWAHLERANLGEAHLERANLCWAHLERADLRSARKLTQEQINQADGDASTLLPEGLTRPKRWTEPGAEEPPPR